MVEVFITDVENEQLAEKISHALIAIFPKMTVHFDLQDCDRILRCESDIIDADAVMTVVKSFSIRISVLI